MAFPALFTSRMSKYPFLATLAIRVKGSAQVVLATEYKGSPRFSKDRSLCMKDKKKKKNFRPLLF